jgi:ABC-type uncharacterized transport system substrate-binding protein
MYADEEASTIFSTHGPFQQKEKMALFVVAFDPSFYVKKTYHNDSIE